MADQVKIEYEQMQNIISVFDDHSQQSQQVLQRVSAQVDVMRSGSWVGANADRFYQEMDNEALVALQRLVNAFQQLTESSSEIVRVMQNAEEEASTIFRVT